MDSNKDDALKCLRIGKEALESGDRVRALKFVNKAQRLDPNLSVDDLVAEIEKNSGDRPTKDADVSPDQPSDHQKHQPSLRQRNPSNGPSSASTSSTANYTVEQFEIVREIKKKKDYYEILGVEKSCTVEDVRKAYRKLSLKVHPDKNKAPGSEEAFKSVSKAFQCLSDGENRKKYDVLGTDEPVYDRRPTRHANGFNGGGFYDTEFDADEIFRNFFFGNMGQTTQFRGFSFGTNMGPRAAHTHHHNEGSGGFNVRMLIQALPILLIVLLNFLPSSEPVYSLSRSYPYEHKYMTEKGVNFYVRTAKFEEEYPVESRERVTLERQIEREYFGILTQNCRLEIQRRQWGFIRETPHCDMLEKFDVRAY